MMEYLARVIAGITFLLWLALTAAVVCSLCSQVFAGERMPGSRDQRRVPTATKVPTDTPAPTATLVSTPTLVPTATPRATDTPANTAVPTATRVPTDTPPPTATLVATPTPVTLSQTFITVNTEASLTGSRSLAVTAPLAKADAGAGSTLTLSIPAATDSVDGYMAAVDHKRDAYASSTVIRYVGGGI